MGRGFDICVDAGIIIAELMRQKTKQGSPPIVTLAEVREFGQAVQTACNERRDIEAVILTPGSYLKVTCMEYRYWFRLAEREVPVIEFVGDSLEKCVSYFVSCYPMNLTKLIRRMADKL